MYYLDFLHFLCPFFSSFSEKFAWKSWHYVNRIQLFLLLSHKPAAFLRHPVYNTDMVYFDCFELATWFLSRSHDNHDFITL